MLASMRWAGWSSLAAATLYAGVTVLVLRDRDPGIPTPVLNGLELRPVTWVAQWLPPPQEDGGFGPWQWMADGLGRGLEEVAHRPLADPEDRWRGAAAAVALGRRHLVPVLLGPRGAEDPAAARLIAWAFDPDPVDDGVAAEEVSFLPEGLQAMLLATTSRDPGRASAARDRWRALSESWQGRLGAVMMFLLGALVGGGWMWRSLRRRLREDSPGLRPRLTEATLLPPLQVIAFFAAGMVTVGVFAPWLWGTLGLPGGTGGAALATYLLQAAVGIALVATIGRGDLREEGLIERLGWRFGGGEGPGAAVWWGLAGWSLLWLFTFTASVAMLLLLGIGSDPFENPIALWVVLDPDPLSRAFLVGTAVVVAPLFEETLFRGYLLGRFRRHLSPSRSAAVSGLLFALVHFSLESLVPLWALGFALGMLYQRTRSLWTPVLAHGLWNLGTILALGTIFA